MGQFTIETDLQDYILEITDLTGKMIYREESVTQNVYNMELTSIESGVYFVRLYNDEQSVVERVVIEK